jgi:hypothetical protein
VLTPANYTTKVKAITWSSWTICSASAPAAEASLKFKIVTKAIKLQKFEFKEMQLAVNISLLLSRKFRKIKKEDLQLLLDGVQTEKIGPKSVAES